MASKVNKFNNDYLRALFYKWLLRLEGELLNKHIEHTRCLIDTIYNTLFNEGFAWLRFRTLLVAKIHT